ncbi:uncharacterized protein BP5553_06890 [Venustampulla echinocandica]|uniref:Uncharacterized protein n=1 Tax=Venustampulla echinocandica TaxID=2656787 RepID=A0A370TL75_9HELO|nr:uncharacterized protein BP5553_06890 [Venustampulla echinocandica]RDL36278.1 hypothetical protein BP5553_06890 [Venustampulla echinocandica]
MGSGEVGKKPKGNNPKTSSSKATKDKVGKVNSSKTPETPAQKKKKIAEDIRKHKLVLEGSRSQREGCKPRLEEITKSYGNGAHPEFKDEYDRCNKEFDEMTSVLAKYEADLNELMEEQRAVVAMDGVEESTNPLNEPNPYDVIGPAPPINVIGNGRPANPVDTAPINVIGNGSPANPADEDDDDAGLITPEKNREVSGRGDAGVVVGWRKRGQSTQVIIRHGPKNSPRYERSTKFRSGLSFSLKTTPQIGPDHRHGDEKNGRIHVRQMDDFKGMLGVSYNCPLEDLRPRPVTGLKNYPKSVEIWVKWCIDGMIYREWEVVSSIKHLWANPTEFEEYVYNTASDHNEKHQAWLSGQREGKETSPTPAPQTAYRRKEVKIEVPSEFEKFRQEWAEMQNPKLDPNNLNPMQAFVLKKLYQDFSEEL